MASTAETLRSSLLSAAQIKELTGWPDQLILDYLTIVQNFIDLSDVIDENDTSITSKVADAEQLIQNNSALISAFGSTLNDLKSEINDINAEIATINSEISTINTQLSQISIDINALYQLVMQNTALIKS